MTISFKRLIVVYLLFLSITGCKQKNTPDVSGIEVKINIERFDQFMFRKMDTADITRGAAELQSAYPYFTNDFLVYILGLPGLAQSLPNTALHVTRAELKRFITLTTPLYDSLAASFNNTNDVKERLSQSFKYVKYYYPQYTVPKVVYYLGPFDAPGVAITNQALAVGLQLFAGRNFSFYQTPQGQEMFPGYISRNFSPEYIPVNCMKAVAEDIYPDKSAGRPLIEEMIEKGKQWYLTRHFMPGVADSLLTGYTARQAKWCQENEASIWNYFLQGNELYTSEPMVVKNYIGDSPNTQGMPDAAPGNIGQWVGLQILERYAQKNPALKPDDILKVPANKIFAGAKYKPKN